MTGWSLSPWTPGATISLTIEDGSGVVHSDSQTADAAGNFKFDLSGVFDVQRGHLVTVSDSTYTKTHTVANLFLDIVDVATDIVYGRADAGTSVDVWVHENGGLTVTADVSGNWTADFSGMTDLTYLSGIGSGQTDDDGDATIVYWAGPLPLPVEIDIKPGSYPNCLNMNGHGLITVAILGSDTFEANQIDISTLKFAGLDVRVKGNSKPQCSIEDVSGDFTDPAGAPDGYDDLVCHFVDYADAWSPDNGTATLKGALLDGTPIEGTDTICIVP